MSEEKSKKEEEIIDKKIEDNPINFLYQKDYLKNLLESQSDCV
jgi:hypothetical protein